MRHSLAKFLVLALAALSLAAAGCGGDDDEPTVETGVSGATGASGVPLTAAEFSSTADEICEEASEELDQEIQGLTQGGEPSPEELEGYVESSLVPSIQAQIDAIAELTPPEDQEDEVAAFLESGQAELDALEADPSLLSEDSFQATNALAQDLGLRECAS